jgi:hypothetical protein
MWAGLHILLSFYELPVKKTKNVLEPQTHPH